MNKILKLVTVNRFKNRRFELWPFVRVNLLFFFIVNDSNANLLAAVKRFGDRRFEFWPFVNDFVFDNVKVPFLFDL